MHFLESSVDVPLQTHRAKLVASRPEPYKFNL